MDRHGEDPPSMARSGRGASSTRPGTDFSTDIQGATMSRFDHITQGPFSVRITKDGRDITAVAGVQEVHYKADGTGTRTLSDGTVLQGQWRFLDEEQTTVETSMAGKLQR